MSMHTAAAPGKPLSPREREVLALLIAGLTARQVADRLFVSKRTVDFHTANIHIKFGVNSMVLVIQHTCDVVIKEQFAPEVITPHQ
jgi:DNA-binding CsgD family transcriptional regulator